MCHRALHSDLTPQLYGGGYSHHPLEKAYQGVGRTQPFLSSFHSSAVGLVPRPRMKGLGLGTSPGLAGGLVPRLFGMPGNEARLWVPGPGTGSTSVRARYANIAVLIPANWLQIWALRYIHVHVAVRMV